jgi:hypothetical protein
MGFFRISTRLPNLPGAPPATRIGEARGTRRARIARFPRNRHETGLSRGSLPRRSCSAARAPGGRHTRRRGTRLNARVESADVRVAIENRIDRPWHLLPRPDTEKDMSPDGAIGKPTGRHAVGSRTSAWEPRRVPEGPEFVEQEAHRTTEPATHDRRVRTGRSSSAPQVPPPARRRGNDHDLKDDQGDDHRSDLRRRRNVRSLRRGARRSAGPRPWTQLFRGSPEARATGRSETGRREPPEKGDIMLFPPPHPPKIFKF